jgi:hypothetical protein
MHEDTREIELNLEADVDIGTIDRRTPPQGESTVRNLVETGTLSVRELLVSHRLLESGRLFPEETWQWCLSICSTQPTDETHPPR